MLDNWSAPNLRGDLNTGLGRWSEEELFQYLKTGRNRFGSAFGVMRDVIVYSTRFMTDDDLRAMAKYLKSLSPSIDRTQPVWVYNNQTADALAARRYSEGGMPTCCWKKRVKLDWAEKPSSAGTSAILVLPEASLAIADSTHSMSR